MYFLSEILVRANYSIYPLRAHNQKKMKDQSQLDRYQCHNPAQNYDTRLLKQDADIDHRDKSVGIACKGLKQYKMIELPN